MARITFIWCAELYSFHWLRKLCWADADRGIVQTFYSSLSMPTCLYPIQFIFMLCPCLSTKPFGHCILNVMERQLQCQGGSALDGGQDYTTIIDGPFGESHSHVLSLLACRGDSRIRGFGVLTLQAGKIHFTLLSCRAISFSHLWTRNITLFAALEWFLKGPKMERGLICGTFISNAMENMYNKWAYIDFC